MPTVLPPATTVATLNTLTVQDIIDCVQQDTQDRLATGPANNLLIDYTDRIQQMILGRRSSGWDWMLSENFEFVTETGQTNYWIGPTGSTPVGAVDTGLDFSDVRHVQNSHVWVRDRWIPLWRTEESPQSPDWQNPDGSYRLGKPAEYRSDRLSPYLITVYPAPDEGNDYEIVPPPPQSTTAAGGALAARTYFLKTTFVDEAGNEGSPSTQAARQWVAANKLITVKAPQPAIAKGTAGISYTQYNVYAGTDEDVLTLQNVSPTAISSDWTEPGTGLTTTGAAPPTDSDIEPIRGHVLEFRYYKVHTRLTASTDTLLIPDDFHDVVCAGVNWLAAQYLHRQGHSVSNDEINHWQNLYQTGLTRMVQDQNPWPGGARFIKPDTNSRSSRWPMWWR